MPFVKLDCGVLDSSLWVDREQREVFITSLLMAEPFHLTEAMPQLKVRSLEPTGWMVPPGRYGFVRAAGVGIVRRALVEQEPGLQALERLCSPDQESRSEDFEGRRLARVDGGYIVLNFFKYRDFDYTSAARSQRYREKKNGVTSPVTGVASRRDITHADADADADSSDRSPQEPLLLATGDAGSRPDKPVKAKPPNCPHEAIVELYHQILPELPRVLEWNARRRSYLNTAWAAKPKRQNLEYWRLFFEFVKLSDLLMGRLPPQKDRSPWKADLEWMVKPANFLKINEKKYHHE